MFPSSNRRYTCESAVAVPNCLVLINRNPPLADYDRNYKTDGDLLLYIHTLRLTHSSSKSPNGAQKCPAAIETYRFRHHIDYIATNIDSDPCLRADGFSVLYIRIRNAVWRTRTKSGK